MSSADESDQARTVAATTEQVLLREYELIWGPAGIPPNESAYRTAMLEKDQSALCLSGGGIRSAAFALGVLQSLSSRGLLTSFHYLSTVSGGGYIGGWLQRWIHESGKDARKVMDRLGAGKNPPEIAALRENSNFITPRVGMGSNDTWTALAMSLRNIAINWMLFVPLMLMVVILPNLFKSGVASMAPNDQQYEFLLFGAAALGAFAVAVASWFTCAGMPSYRGASPAGVGKGDGWLFWRIVLPLLIWTVCATLVLASELIGHDRWLESVPDWMANRVPEWMTFGLDRNSWVPEGALVILMTLPPMALGLIASGLARGRGYRLTFGSDILPTALALLTPPVLILAGAMLFHTFTPALPADLNQPRAESAAEWRAILLTVFGPLWLLGTHLALTIVFVALRRPKGTNVKPDADREWLARLSAVKSKPMLLWLIAGGSALLLNHLLNQLASSYDMSVASFLAAATGLTAVSSARSEKSGDAIGPMRGKAGKAFGFIRKLPVQMIATIAAFLFIVLLFLILARIEWTLAAPIARYYAGSLEPWVDPYVVAHSLLLGLLFVLTMLVSYRIEANRFSLHGLYRNRLARGFLGAARPMRDPDTFTGFDPKDNVRVHTLAPKDPKDPKGAGTGRVLYPVINAALNVTASENLAWQERKAEPFIFTPEFSGSGMLPNEGMEEARKIEAARVLAQKDPDGDPVAVAPSPPAPAPAPASTAEAELRPHRPPLEGAYIRSEVYGGSEPDLATGDSGVSLATAMTISGAAASPNMGYNSSPAAAFLMTLFNVRLGAWLPNPARARTLGKEVGNSSPNNSLRALLRELGGSTDDRGLDIYLSDGGHFENLGIYEMIRRRCRYILVTDAGQDAECGFADLGNAVRKVKIDFDVDIRFDKIHIYPRDAAPTSSNPVAWACGTVRYPEGSGPEQTGIIVYLKPSYFGEDLPVDVVSYGRASAAFPHESTGDQFFSESQFESYRRLGQFFADKLGLQKLDEEEPTELDLPTFFKRIRREARI